MATLRITIDPEMLDRVEKRAAEEGTSVGEVVETYLESYASHAVPPPESSTGNEASALVRKPFVKPIPSSQERQEFAQSISDLWALMDEHPSGSGPEGRTWTREDIYDRPIPRRAR